MAKIRKEQVVDVALDLLGEVGLDGVDRAGAAPCALGPREGGAMAGLVRRQHAQLSPRWVRCWGGGLEVMGLTSTAWVGTVAVGLGIAWILWQMRRPAFLDARLHG